MNALRERWASVVPPTRPRCARRRRRTAEVIDADASRAAAPDRRGRPDPAGDRRVEKEYQDFTTPRPGPTDASPGEAPPGAGRTPRPNAGSNPGGPVSLNVAAPGTAANRPAPPAARGNSDCRRVRRDGPDLRLFLRRCRRRHAADAATGTRGGHAPRSTALHLYRSSVAFRSSGCSRWGTVDYRVALAAHRRRSRGLRLRAVGRRGIAPPPDLDDASRLDF